MMMGGMMGAGFGWILLLYTILMIALILGFSYIIWILSMKETGYVKTTGMVIACVIAVLAVILFLYGLIYGGRMGGRYGTGQGMMENKEGSRYMHEMMKGAGMEKQIKEHMREHGKELK